MSTPKERAKLRMKRIQESMVPLIGDTRFQAFMEEVEEQQKAAMMDACNERVIANDRICMATLGEVRAYDGLLSFYRSRAEQVEHPDGPTD